MADKKLNIKVSTTGAGKAKQEVGGLNGAISKMGKAVGIASAAYFGARGLISGFSTVIRLAGIQEQAEKKLEVALGKTSKSLLDHASALQKVTTFGDEAIIGVQASLAAFIKNEDQIKKATEATLDMAVAMGMDLKAAGDLVAKTLGSSTNAMSRYGIEVVGAVGSTERLESLTNNVAKLFGGQASAQADTMTGSMEQMKNALGDVAENIGESLSPLVVKLAKGINSLATSTADESAEADSLFNVLKDVNATEEVRERAMQAINEQYGDYLPNLIDETFSLQDIEKAQNRVTGAMLKRIALSVNEEEIADLMRDKLELMDQESVLINRVATATANKDKISVSGMVNLQDGLSGIVLAEGKLEKNRENQVAVQSEINTLNESAVGLAEAFSESILRMPEKPLVIIEPEQIDILDDIIIDMSIMNGLMEETFGTGKKVEDTMKDQIQLAGALSSALQTTFDPDLGAGEAFKGFVLQLMSAMQGVILASKVVSEALTFTFTGPLGVGAAVAALIGLEAAKAGVRSLEFAETGFDGIVNSPTMFMTGEGNKAERVSVTPLQGPNINGPQGGITLNIQGNMIGNESFVRDVLIPEISNAKRMNLA